ncbi:MAG: glycosyltransferase, partial [bacterium]|nr:glycosyltransferase [bacterium]
APIFVLIHQPDATHASLRDAKIIPSFLQNLPFAKSHYQWTLPLMPMAVEHIDLSGFDLIISSSSSFAKGIITPPGAIHVCYCHTPTRFLWEERVNYVEDLPQLRMLRPLLLPVLHNIRQWDKLAVLRPDHIVTNSQISRDRIARYYGRDAEILSPPVETELIPLGSGSGGYWLAGGRLVPYKKFDLVVKAFAKLNMTLKIFGTGPEEKKLRQMAGAKTEFLGHVSDDERVRLYQDAIGFISPQIEDFGITMVEAMSAGRPILTFKKGGGAEIVRDGVTGIHLAHQAWEDIGDAVIRFEPERFDPAVIRRHAEQYSSARFKESFANILSHAMDH